MRIVGFPTLHKEKHEFISLFGILFEKTFHRLFQHALQEKNTIKSFSRDFCAVDTDSIECYETLHKWLEASQRISWHVRAKESLVA